VLERIEQNAHVIGISPDYGINSTFNVEDLVAYKGQPVIPNDLFQDLLSDLDTNHILDLVQLPLPTST
jgi:hypothetical protein